MADDITKKVTVSIDVPKVSGSPELSNLAKQSRETAAAVSSISAGFGKLAPSMKTVGTNAREMWRDIADGAKKSENAIRGVGNEIDKLKQKGHGLAGMLGLSDKQFKTFSKMTGVAPALGMGRLAMAGGGIGLGIMAAHDLGSLGLNAMYNKKFGSEPLQKEDAGMILGTIGSTIDTFTGRKFRERSQDKAIEKIRTDAERVGRLETTGMAIEDRMRALALPVSVLGPSDAQMRNRFANLEELKAPVERRMRQRGFEIQDMDFTRREALGVASRSSGQERAKALQDVERAQQRINQLTEQQARDQEAIVGLEEQRQRLMVQNIQQTAASVRSKAEQFAEMDPIQRQMATELGGRLRRGEQLNPEEMENARDMPILRDLVRDRQIREMDRGPQFREFIREAGNDAERAHAERAERRGIGVVATLEMDEQRLTEVFRQALEPLGFRLNRIAADQVREADNNRRLNNQRNGDRDAVIAR